MSGGNVVILGGGNACDMAIGIGCNVIILDVNIKQIEYLKQKYINDPVEIIEFNT
ncbi:Alanine dehydrogenase [Bacillus thuringiensis IBL 200]|uniref:Alanine dehydrogenase/pyridine nucleotide transhydrogenase NAD(H)-binding domain-containing protein n=1 Tax=Bacillus thuringiensis serovar toumanoffi TaxID=180862 RepID=A0ABD5I8Y8_BACTU|nr:Alanine dehydrogenase [Bacillus thuringiensis IBL 200]MDW9213576.1 hypothetical protein [Bacillus thuringiensis serovar toumanoffi]